jgi:hypothetical protein
MYTAENIVVYTTTVFMICFPLNLPYEVLQQLMISQKKDKKKIQAINFRIPESVWEAAHERAILAGKNVNEWVRDELIGRLDERHGMTPAERLMYVEINNLRNLVEKTMLAGMNADKGALSELVDGKSETLGKPHFPSNSARARANSSTSSGAGGATSSGASGAVSVGARFPS